MEVQKLFEQDPSMQSLRDLGIHINFYNHKIGLDYDQINSWPFKTHPIVVECRGLILDLNHNPVCRTFDRFFNLGENDVDSVDLDNSVILEKVDGTMFNVYFDNNQNSWYVSTRRQIEAEQNLDGDRLTWKELFEKYFGDINDKMKNMNKSYTYIMEGAFKENQNVTIYDRPRIVLLGVRHTYTGDYYSLDRMFEAAKSIGIEMPKIYNFDTIENLIESFVDLAPRDEGYVLWNTKTQLRIKVKNPEYLILHRMVGNNLSFKKIINLVWDCEQDEYLATFPEKIHLFQPIIDAYSKFVSDIITNADYVEKNYNLDDKNNIYNVVLKDNPLRHYIIQKLYGKDRYNGPRALNPKRQQIIKQYLTKE
jgi:T4 RnlA family RNA ligase